MSDQVAESTEEILSNLSKALQSKKGVDADLAKIVTDNILVADPASDCVDAALTAISSLAEERATTPKEDKADA